jgi:hypothetical protein
MTLKESSFTSGYYPMFDLSTIHFIDYSINTLITTNDDAIKFVKRLRNANSIFLESNNDPYHSIKSILKDTGSFFKNNRHSTSFESNKFMILLFGLLSMPRLIESICLGDKLIFCGGNYYNKVPLQNTSKYLYDIDESHEKLWISVSDNKQQTREFLQFQNDLFSNLKQKEQLLIKALSYAYLHQPLANLWGCLHYASTGMYWNPVVQDTSLHNGLEDLTFKILTPYDDFKKINKSKIIFSESLQEEPSYEWVLMHKYLMNSLIYHTYAYYHGYHYVSNSLREPFLYSLDFLTEKEFIKDKIIDNIHFAVKEIQNIDKINASKRNINPKSINKRTILFIACLSIAKDTSDIIPAAYRLRDELSDLRIKLREIEDTNKFDEEVQDFVKEKIKLYEIENRYETFFSYIINLPIDGKYLSNIYEKYKKKRGGPTFRSLNTLYDNYRTIFSATEKLYSLYREQAKMSDEAMKNYPT